MKTPRPEWLQNILNYILDNVFDILTIGASAYVVLRHQFNPYGPNDIAQLATWILAILGFIAVSGLWHQHRRLAAIETLSHETHHLVSKHLAGEVQAEDFFWGNNKKVNTDDFAKATDIYIVGITLNRTIRNHIGALGDRLAAGANLRFIILDKSNEALLEPVTYRSFGARTPGWWQDRVRQTEGLIEDIPTSKDMPGTLQLGHLPYFPSFGMWLIDPDKPYGQIHIEIYHHRTPEMNPTFSLRATEDAYWYGFFRKQFDLLWESCEKHGKITDIDK